MFCVPHRVSDLDVNVGGGAEHVVEECEKRPARPQENFIDLSPNLKVC